MAARNSFKSGSCEMIVLHILKNYGDCYAYQISQYIKKYSNEKLYFPEGSLYPAFYKLIDHHYISDYKMKTGKRQVKVFYHIEPAGEKRLKQLLSDYRSLVDSIDTLLAFDFASLKETQDE